MIFLSVPQATLHTFFCLEGYTHTHTNSLNLQPTPLLVAFCVYLAIPLGVDVDDIMPPVVVSAVHQDCVQDVVCLRLLLLLQELVQVQPLWELKPASTQQWHFFLFQTTSLHQKGLNSLRTVLLHSYVADKLQFTCLHLIVCMQFPSIIVIVNAIEGE